MDRIASLAAYDAAAPEGDNRIKGYEVVEAISEMKSGRTSGLDLITAELLTATIDEGEWGMVDGLTQIFNRIIKDTGTLPEQWAKAEVRRIHKAGGDGDDWSNYRLMPHLAHQRSSR
jgi:hypothetical protein